MIAVIGATGNTGRATVKELQALGEDPLCVIRDPEKAKKVLAPDSKTAVAEITDRAALEKALKGIKSVFVVTGHNPQTGEQQINILEAAKAAGVEFFAKVSGGRALVSPDSPSVVGRGHYEIEQAIKSSGLDWCILSPGLFMQNTFTQIESIKNDGKIIQPFANDLPLAFIDVRDTGAVGARIVADPTPHIG
ncbi:MAG: NAD(P)H-binding protein, partial [Gammaproteobacteria bacterium]